MQPKESLGPKLLSLNENRIKSACMIAVIIVLSVFCYCSEISRLPYYLEWTLLSFTAFRLGHVISRFVVLFSEKDDLMKLYRKSRICFWEYSVGDLVPELVLCTLTFFYYQCKCNGNGINYALLCCVVSSFLYYLAKFPEQYLIKRVHAEKHNLNIGYGLAYFYYHNYLAHLVKDDKFTERLREYVHEEEVPLSSYKLFILVPYDCVIEKYIDNNPRESLRTKETKPLKLNVAGIKGRIYVNTVYELFTDGPSNPQGIVRCCIECAQPLKQLREYCTEGRISEEQMLYERKSFIFNLEKFLHDDCNSYKTVILVQCEGEDIVPSVKKAAARFLEQKEV